MKRIFPLFLMLSITLACSAKKGAETEPLASSTGPKLTLSALPRQGFAPMRVSINAKLTGISEKDEDYYCLKEEWEFGDGALSSQQPNCEPFSAEESRAATEFFADHLYDDPGTYTIRFVLGDKKIRSNSLTVIVLDSDVRAN